MVVQLNSIIRYIDCRYTFSPAFKPNVEYKVVINTLLTNEILLQFDVSYTMRSMYDSSISTGNLPQEVDDSSWPHYRPHEILILT